jgi:hypothetical protein
MDPDGMYLSADAGVNFTNVLRAAFTLVDPESIKNTFESSVSFYDFGLVKAVRRTLMKFSQPPDVEDILAKYFTFKEDQSCQLKVVTAPASTVITSTQQVLHFFEKTNSMLLIF